MTKKNIEFSTSSTSFYFDASFDHLGKLTSKDNTIIITDENIFRKNERKFKNWKHIIIEAGEQHKNQRTVDSIIESLIGYGADRKTFIVGVGGGVVTDIAGYVAGIYMRGVKFGFVPTSILAMVDAAIGGKNGIDVGVYKNMVGLIRQPAFLLYDYSFLKSLPQEEWVNGFAEIIKHACIKDAAMFRNLEEQKLRDFQKNRESLNKLIQKNALIKSKVVREDEFEQGDRKLLNYGHTLGHAIENSYRLPHGHAVTVGMVAAAFLSEKLTGFKDAKRIVSLIRQYNLTADYRFDPEKAMQVMLADKKRIKDTINYILLQKIGKGIVKPLKVDDIKAVLFQLSNQTIPA